MGTRIDQHCVVGTSHNSRSSRFVRVEMRDENSNKLRCKKDISCDDEKIGRLSKKNVGGDRNSNRESSEGEDDTDNNSSNHQGNDVDENNTANTGAISNSVIKETANTEFKPLFFSDYLSQLTCRIPLGPHLSSKKVTAIVSTINFFVPLTSLPVKFPYSSFSLLFVIYFLVFFVFCSILVPHISFLLYIICLFSSCTSSSILGSFEYRIWGPGPFNGTTHDLRPIASYPPPTCSSFQ